MSRPVKKDFKTNGDFNRAIDAYIDHLETALGEAVAYIDVVDSTDADEGIKIEQDG